MHKFPQAAGRRLGQCAARAFHRVRQHDDAVFASLRFWTWIAKSRFKRIQLTIAYRGRIALALLYSESFAIEILHERLAMMLLNEVDYGMR